MRTPHRRRPPPACCGDCSNPRSLWAGRGCHNPSHSRSLLSEQEYPWARPARPRRGRRSCRRCRRSPPPCRPPRRSGCRRRSAGRCPCTSRPRPSRTNTTRAGLCPFRVDLAPEAPRTRPREPTPRRPHSAVPRPDAWAACRPEAPRGSRCSPSGGGLAHNHLRGSARSFCQRTQRRRISSGSASCSPLHTPPAEPVLSGSAWAQHAPPRRHPPPNASPLSGPAAAETWGR
mmetsp:Transcript_163052/g.517931  ORF Transcript_163052/g.517931 Transcript_163052/m.517931 type:complete len:231 (+) Transcript_163052:1042-1734(+)